MNVSPKLTAHTEKKEKNLQTSSVVFTKVLKKCITSRCHSSAVSPMKLLYVEPVDLHFTVSVFSSICEDHRKDQKRTSRLFELMRIDNDTEGQAFYRSEINA